MRPFEPGEVRTITYAIEVNVGYLQTDGTRSLPADLDDWAIRFNSSDSWTYVELGGRVVRGVINGSGAPWPDNDPSLYDDAVGTATTAEGSESEGTETLEPGFGSDRDRGNNERLRGQRGLQLDLAPLLVLRRRRAPIPCRGRMSATVVWCAIC